VLEQAGGVLRERRAWQYERHAQAAQARLSARVLTWLPMAFAAWGIATSGRVRAAYSATPLTVWCTSAGIALNIVGWWWMRRIITGAPS
jgi:Flp pilus assembly protein TadB